MSAFIAGGPPSRIIEEAIDGNIEFVLLGPVLDELERVLSEKLGFDAEHWSDVESLLREVAVEEIPSPTSSPEPVSGDPDDDLILACAIEAPVDALVSGDTKHLLPLGEHGDVRVVKPQVLLAGLAG